MPLLKKAIRETADKDMKKRVGLDGLHCAMTHNTPYDALDFLAVLARDFPRDPDVLYAATHAYSDLSLHASQDLAREAPFSYQVHQLNAEALELQGKWDEAIACHRRAVELDPKSAGTHNTLAWALLTCPDPKLRDPAAALRHAETAVELSPSRSCWQTLAWARYRTGDWKGAVAAMTKVTELGSPGYSREWFLLARYREALHEYLADWLAFAPAPAARRAYSQELSVS